MTEESHVPRWRRYLRFARPNVSADVDEELEFHIAMRVERNVSLGMTADDARREALGRFGDVALVRDALVDHDKRRMHGERRSEYMSDFVQDVRFGFRSLRRAPGFAVAAILTLAIGIGANAAIFSVVDAIVLRQLPYARPEELVSVGTGAAGEYLALRDRLRSFSLLAAYVEQTHPIDDGREALRVEGTAITTNLLATLGVSPAMGRAFTEEEARPGNNNVLLVSDAIWRQHLGGAADVIGKRVLVEGAPFTIVGVMPPDFNFPNRNAQYWQPYAIDQSNVGSTWGVWNKKILGRLAPGVTLAQAQREVREVWPTLRTLNPLWDPGPDYRKEVAAGALQSAVIGSIGSLLWILFGCVLMVLLVGCVNVANLLLARATAREREIAVRVALGGGRARLMRQLVTESLLLAALGAAFGFALAFAGLRSLVAALPPGIPRTNEIAMNGEVLAFTAVVAALTGLLFGVVPAFRATSYSASSSVAVGSGQRTSRGVRQHRLSGALVAAEVALAVLLVLGATLLVRSFNALRSIDTGFRPTHVIAARLTPPEATYRDSASVTSFYATILERLGAAPGVQNVAIVDRLPMAQSVWGRALRVEGQYEDAKHNLPSADHSQQVTPGYFATLGIPLMRGRFFTDADRAGQSPVAIVSTAVARRFWPDADPIGKRIGHPWDSPWMTIVGVVPDTKQDSLRDTSKMSVYFPWAQRTAFTGSEMWIVARVGGDPTSIASAIRSIVHDVDRAVPVSDLRTMDAVLSDSVQRARFTMLLVAAFAIAALLLGAIGIYGVMSYLVGQRMQEMGIRLALGAPPAQVLGLVVRRGATLAALGAALGLIVALFATRSLGSLLYGISATDPLTFIVVPLLFLAVAALASYAPALRATRVDPARALRAD